jgi:PhzF family phenazine biosynthesis protein
MRKYQLYQVDAFTSEKFKGNPAGVVMNAEGLSDAQMLSIARELNNSETAFILPPTGPDHAVWIRFFTPGTEVPSCGHATIAAHYVRAREMNLSSCTVMQKIGIGILPVDIITQDRDYKIVMTQGSIKFTEPFAGTVRQDIVAALALSESDLDNRCPVQVVSTGHSKVLVGIKEKRKLDALQPHLQRLTEISKGIGCNGFFVFSFDSPGAGILASGRMFAPAIGIAEDPVTGNANGPLGAYVIRHKLIEVHDGTIRFNAMQGEAIGRPGVVEVQVDVHNGVPTKTRVGGRAVIVFRTEIEV